MRKIIFQIAFLLLAFTIKAQTFQIKPLPCGVWGEPNWTAYTEKDLAHKVYPHEVSLDLYYNYQPSNQTLYLAEEYTEGYINNLQCIRWSWEESKEPFKVTVSENGRRIILYEAVTTGCGLILFPDSLLKNKHSTLDVYVEDGDMPVMQFSFIADSKYERKTLLAALKECEEIRCQVGTMIQNQRYREALSLLEIERMRNPRDPELESIYWKAASRIRLCPSWPPALSAPKKNGSYIQCY